MNEFDERQRKRREYEREQEHLQLIAQESLRNNKVLKTALQMLFDKYQGALDQIEDARIRKTSADVLEKKPFADVLKTAEFMSRRRFRPCIEMMSFLSSTCHLSPPPF